ncbi:MAG: hypothetical protein ACOYOX_00640 [Limnohabitans sp.]
MLKAYRQRKQNETVMGHRLEEPHLTLWVVFWVFIYLGLPLLLVGSVIDLLIQYATGTCTGFWCWLS